MKSSLVLLIALVVMLSISQVGCGQPRWCDEEWTKFTSWEYEYTVTYPLSCSMTYSDSEYYHNLSIFFADEASEIKVRVHKGMDSDNVESLFQTFKDDILAATEEDVGFVKRYDYEILKSFEGQKLFKEIHYTFTKAQMDVTSGNWKETNMAGETWWYMEEYAPRGYIYSFTYETLADCEKCIWVCRELSQAFFSTVHDNTQ